MRLALHFMTCGHYWLGISVVALFLGDKWASLICMIVGAPFLAAGLYMLILEDTRIPLGKIDEIVRREAAK